MNPVNIDNENFSGEIPQRAVSLYGQNEGMDDFPVLKAFQQYIDAEQEKARKRFLGLGILFGAILVVVIAVFLFLLYGINSRNQALSDRLVEYAMKEADRRQVPVGQTQMSSQNDAILKAMTETLVTLRGKLEGNGGKTSGTGNGKADREDADQILKTKARLDAEKRQLAAERERLRNIEIEQQRRRLYPEFYSNENYGRRKTTNHRGDYLLTDEDIREIIREADAVAEVADDRRHAVSRIKDVEVSDAETKKTVSAEDSEGAIEYFNDDNYTIPVDVKGKSSSSKVNFIVPYE